MPFTLIQGRFKPKVGIPDGDSVRFIANEKELWSRLEGRPVKFGSGQGQDTVQLRFEGIDAIEKGAIQPLATKAKENMFRLIGYDAVANPEPVGYILARMTDDKSGRPICFLFAGSTSQKDGSEVRLETSLLRKSVNYLQVKSGFAYPLYYNTLYAALRRELDKAVASARQGKLGYWPSDKTTKGVAVQSHADLATIPPIWPKLWRRLDDFLKNTEGLDGFVASLKKKNERINILSIMEERGLHTLIKVTGNKVRMTESPENLQVIGRVGKRRR